MNYYLKFYLLFILTDMNVKFVASDIPELIISRIIFWVTCWTNLSLVRPAINRSLLNKCWLLTPDPILGNNTEMRYILWIHLPLKNFILVKGHINANSVRKLIPITQIESATRWLTRGIVHISVQNAERASSKGPVCKYTKRHTISVIFPYVQNKLNLIVKMLFF